MAGHRSVCATSTALVSDIEETLAPQAPWPRLTLRRGGGGRATLTVVQARGRPMVLKDYAQCSRWFRWVCAPILANREAHAYRRMGRLRGVPRLYGRVGRHGLLLEYIDGENCRAAKPVVADSFFAELRGILAEVRRAGVLHMDVKRNVLWARTGQAILLDFAASFVIPWWMLPLRRFLIRTAAAYDEREIIKLKSEVAPHLLTASDREVLAGRAPMEWLVNAVQAVLHAGVRWVAQPGE